MLKKPREHYSQARLDAHAAKMRAEARKRPKYPGVEAMRQARRAPLGLSKTRVFELAEQVAAEVLGECWICSRLGLCWHRERQRISDVLRKAAERIEA